MKIVSLLVLTALLTHCGNNNYKTILLKTTGSVETEPNEASILLHISCTNKNIEKSKNCIIEKSNEIITNLTTFGIQKKDILTTRVDLSKDYIWTNNSNIFKGYKASTSVNIKIRDLKLLDDLYTNLLGNRNITLGPLTYYHSNLDSLNHLAYLNALDKANSLSEIILTKLPENSKIITQISNIEISPSNNDDVITSNEVMEYKGRSKSTISVNVGNMIVEQRLYIEYKIY